MTKIPFDIKYKSQIESGEYKVQTNDGADVRIICWDAEGSQRKDDIVALVKGTLGAENIQRYYVTGKLIADGGCKRNKDLIIVTPEPELTEFERRIKDLLAIKCGIVYNKDTGGCYDLKGLCRVILECARQQFIKDGYIIMKKTFHDAVEKIDPEVMKKVSDKVDMENALRDEYEKGRAEALKEFEKKYKWAWFNEGKIAGRFEGLTEDEKYQLGVHDGKEVALKNLPRWEKTSNKGTFIDTSKVFHDGYCLRIKSLEKLPGFKEE